MTTSQKCSRMLRDADICIFFAEVIVSKACGDCMETEADVGVRRKCGGLPSDLSIFLQYYTVMCKDFC